MNAAAAFIPPAFLFAQKKMTEKQMIGKPKPKLGLLVMAAKSSLPYTQKQAII